MMNQLRKGDGFLVRVTIITMVKIQNVNIVKWQKFMGLRIDDLVHYLTSQGKIRL